MERRWLKDLRKAKGLTLKRLGEAVGLSECYLYNIEEGTRKRRGMDTGLICKIAEATGAKPQKLLQAEMEWIVEGVADG